MTSKPRFHTIYSCGMQAKYLGFHFGSKIGIRIPTLTPQCCHENKMTAPGISLSTLKSQ